MLELFTRNGLFRGPSEGALGHEYRQPYNSEKYLPLRVTDEGKLLGA